MQIIAQLSLESKSTNDYNHMRLHKHLYIYNIEGVPRRFVLCYISKNNKDNRILFFFGITGLMNINNLYFNLFKYSSKKLKHNFLF